MSLIKEAGRLVGRGALRVIFGPETKGFVKAVRRDVNSPLTYHVLVEVDEGGFKHFTNSERESSDNISIDSKTGRMRFHKMDERVGQRWEVRTRGTGMWLLPGSRVERDPFNLKEQL